MSGILHISASHGHYNLLLFTKVIHSIILSFTLSVVFLNDRSIDFSKTSFPQSAIKCFLFHFAMSSRFLKPSSRCLRLLPRIPVTSILPSIFHSIMSFIRQLPRKIWPAKIAFLLFIVCGISHSSLTLCNTFSFFTPSVRLILSLLLQHHNSNLPKYFWYTSRSIQFSAPQRAVFQMQHYTSFFFQFE